MGKEEILGGLRIAVSKGHNVEDVMQSFYNAGYKKEDIESAARDFKNEQTFQPQNFIFPPNSVQPKPTLIPIKKPLEENKMVLPQLIKSPLPSTSVPSPTILPQPPTQNPYFQTPASGINQTISSYNPIQQKKGIDLLTVILIITLALLLGVLAATFFFKQDIIEFLNKVLD